ncbi:MAG TPA: N-acetylglutaminylglutamine synthetase [Gammaproteobacteria bacterium]
MSKRAQSERLLRKQAPSHALLKQQQRHQAITDAPENVVIHCGWGRLLLGHTFESESLLADTLLEEKPGERDIAIYVSNPHLVLNRAPQSLFLDPSDTWRLWLNNYRPRPRSIPGVLIRRATSMHDIEAINNIYLGRQMVPLNADDALKNLYSSRLLYLVAEGTGTGRIVGTVMGINHEKVFNDPEKGSSLWCLAVAPDCKTAGVGEALVRYLIEYYQARGCQYLDLSVLHDNESAKNLYRKLKFESINTFTIKTKNAINERLFAGVPQWPNLNPYARIIVDEALSRGIEVVMDDEENGLFTLNLGGRQIRCHESLTDITSAVSMTLCQNKLLTHKILARAGLTTPEFTLYRDMPQAEEFLQRHRSIVVKPIDSEQGHGISVDIRDTSGLQAAIERAQTVSSEIILERYHSGQDLRVLVIGQHVVAAAIRRPAEIIGDGEKDIKTLVEKLSRRRQAATGGESRVPLDAETERCINEAGYDWHSVLEPNQHLFVRKTANLHTGGVLIDVTEQLHPALRKSALAAAAALNIPVTGIDMIINGSDKPDYVIIEANERPGLANHEPHPTAQRFIDLLFPYSEEIKR